MLDIMNCGTMLECAFTFGGFQLTMNSLRYFPIAGAAFLILWVLGRRRFLAARIQQKFPEAKRIWYEIRWSFVTLIVFAAVASGSMLLSRNGVTSLYFDFGERGAGYALFSLVLLTAWHETWFYWMHRLLHRRSFFKPIHLTHHRSTNPSPFAAYGFNQWEAFLEGIYLPIFVLLVPAHPLVLLVHLAYAMLLNIWWHSGYEFFPSGWTRARITKWINTSTHHNMHHSHFNGNYSLYFNFWDRLCGTNFKNYDEYFEQVVARRDAERGRRRAQRRGEMIPEAPDVAA